MGEALRGEQGVAMGALLAGLTVDGLDNRVRCVLIADVLRAAYEAGKTDGKSGLS